MRPNDYNYWSAINVFDHMRIRTFSTWKKKRKKNDFLTFSTSSDSTISFFPLVLFIRFKFWKKYRYKCQYLWSNKVELVVTNENWKIKIKTHLYFTLYHQIQLPHLWEYWEYTALYYTQKQTGVPCAVRWLNSKATVKSKNKSYHVIIGYEFHVIWCSVNVVRLNEKRKQIYETKCSCLKKHAHSLSLFNC